MPKEYIHSSQGSLNILVIITDSVVPCMNCRAAGLQFEMFESAYSFSSESSRK